MRTNDVSYKLASRHALLTWLEQPLNTTLKKVVCDRLFKLDQELNLGDAFIASEIKKYDPFQSGMSACPHCGAATDSSFILNQGVCYTCYQEDVLGASR